MKIDSTCRNALFRHCCGSPVNDEHLYTYIVSTQVPYPWPYLIADVPKEVETRAVLPVDSSVCGRGVRFESNRMNIVNKQVIFIP